MKNKHAFVHQIGRCLSAQKALTGRSWAMVKWPIHTNWFWHEKNNVGGHVLGVGGVQWANA